MTEKNRKREQSPPPRQPIRQSPANHGAGAKRQRVASRTITKALTVVVLLVAAPVASALVEIDVLDGLIAEQDVTPSSSNPGPVMHSTTDAITFDTGDTDVSIIWYAEFDRVVDNESLQSKTMFGTSYTYADWFYGKQGSAANYTTMNATGTVDADAGSYTVPALFNQDSQGTLSIRHYTAASPTDGGTLATFYWAYDATDNVYVFGPAKDLSLAIEVAPISTASALTYAHTFASNDYVVTAVGSSPDHEPTVTQGLHMLLGVLPLSHSWYVLMDGPDGIHENTYNATLTATAQSV